MTPSDDANADDANARRSTPVPKRGQKRSPARRPAPTRRPADQRRSQIAQQRKRRNTLLAAGIIGLVVVIVAVFVVINVTKGKAKNITTTSVVSPTLYQQLTSPTVDSLHSAVTGYDLPVEDPTYGTYPTVTSDPPTSTTAAKPEVLYLGAEYCPYCATERWALTLALSKFGTFSGLHFIHSDNDAGETFREVPTLSYYRSTYTSPYLTFTPVEQETVSGATLQKPTAAETALATKYDTEGSIPFVYMDGKATIIGAEYDPALLIGKSFPTVISEIAGGTTALASNVQADAGAIVSDLCKVTGGKPGDVCKLFPTQIGKFPS